MDGALMPEGKRLTERLRVGVIGCGPIGILHAEAVARSQHGGLLSVCDVDPERAQAAGRRFDVRPFRTIQAMLEEERLDAAVIATPDHLHVAPALEAIAAGCHVLCEKPLALSVDEARSMVDAAALRGVRLGVNYNRRFGFGYRRAAEWIASGRAGEIGHAVIHVADHVPAPGIGRSPHAILTNLLSHHVDLLRWLCGEIRSVHARASGRGPPPPVRDVVLSLGFSSGAVGSIVSGYRDGHERTCERAELFGSKATIVVDDVTRQASLYETAPDRLEVHRPNLFRENDTFYDTLAAHTRAFLEQVAGGNEAPVPGRDGLRGMEIAQAAIASLETGKAVDV